MNRPTHGILMGRIMVVLVLFVLVVSCAEEERSRTTDEEDLREMLATMVEGINERNPGKIEKLAVEGFDAQSLIDTLWALRDAQQLTHFVRRLRISDEEARSAIEMRYIRNREIVFRQSLAVGMGYIDDKWKIIEFRLFGP